MVFKGKPHCYCQFAYVHAVAVESSAENENEPLHGLNPYPAYLDDMTRAMVRDVAVMR